MSLDAVCEVFEQIANTSGRKEKEALLRQLSFRKDDITPKLLFNALDWYTRFGIATLEEAEGDPHGYDHLNRFEGLLSILQGSGSRKREEALRVLNTYKPLTAKWLRRVILKDLKMGVQSTTVNKIWPGLCRTFECQLASDISDLESLIYPKLVEPKIDGVRALFIIDGQNGVRCLSRSGNELYNVEKICSELKLIQQGSIFNREPLVFDGELFTNSLRDTLSVVRTKNQSIDIRERGLHFHLFDTINYTEWVQQQSSVPQKERSKKIEEIGFTSSSLMFVKPINGNLAHTPSQVEMFYNEHLAQGYEGSVVKDLQATYVFDRSNAWQKYKPFDIEIFEITGYYEGSGRLAGHLGGFEVESSDGVSTSVGGGYSDIQRQDYFHGAKACIGKKIKVKYKEKTPDGKLREPVFLGFA